jgi:hypothetical protein
LKSLFILNRICHNIDFGSTFPFLSRVEGVVTEEESLRSALCESFFLLDISNDSDKISNQVDSFVALRNTSIEEVELYSYGVDPGKYEFWDKVGQGVGNLKALGALLIYLNNGIDEPDWETLARILPHTQNKIGLRIMGGQIRGTVEIRAFARAIQGQPATTRFYTGEGGFSFENTDPLYSAVSTLPNLKSAFLQHRKLGRGEGVPTFGSPESMTGFLRAPSLRIMEFHQFYFASSLCLATSMALSQGSSIASLVLDECSFPDGGSEQIASALEENEALTTFKVTPFPDSIHQAFYDAMAASLLSNSTLQELSIRYPGAGNPTSVCVSPLLLALGMNKTLRKLGASGLSSMFESVIPALREGLGKNTTLEILELTGGGALDVAHTTSFRIAAVEAL